LVTRSFQKIRCFLEEFPVAWKEFENLFERNRIFIDRTVNVGAITAEKAMAYGFTGPNLRAAGVDYDVRVAQPYSSYEDFDFMFLLENLVILTIVFVFVMQKFGKV
jgi:NADH-quinone oxidoreductase subunit D